jgi:uncharacterized membrane protein YgcG
LIIISLTIRRNIEMRKIAIALLIVTSLAGCNTQHRYHKEKKVVMHFSDGRWGYQDNGIWYWLIMNQATQNNLNSVSRGSSPNLSTAAWTRGSAPSAKQAEEAEEVETEVTETVDGEPVEATEAVEASEDTSSATETDSASGGADTGSSGSDSGSSDSGSSGDSGGGGDAGGGE